MKELLQRALDALENCSSEYGHRCNRCDSEVDEGGRVAASLRAAIAAEGEPVAWAISYDGVRPYSLWDSGDGPLLDLEVKRLGGAAKKMPLYTAPPTAEPMSEEEIRELSAKHIKSGMFKGAPATWGIVDFARAIEARKARPMTDEEMILRGWRRCAVGQRSSQYCGQLQKAVAAEREACAKVLDDWKKHNWTFEDCAAVVRARGQK